MFNKVSCFTVTRELKVGDVIQCQGSKVTIGEILAQDCYIDGYYKDSYYRFKDSAPERLEHFTDGTTIDIEFKDLRGNYHHWKSNLDGGVFEYKTTEITKDLAIEIEKDFNSKFKNTGLKLKEAREAIQNKYMVSNNVMNSIIVHALQDLIWED